MNIKRKIIFIIKRIVSALRHFKDYIRNPDVYSLKHFGDFISNPDVYRLKHFGDFISNPDVYGLKHFGDFINNPDVYGLKHFGDFISNPGVYGLKQFKAFIRYPEMYDKLALNYYNLYEPLDVPEEKDINNATLLYLKKINYLGKIIGVSGISSEYISLMKGILKGRNIQTVVKEDYSEYGVIIFCGADRCEKLADSIPFINDSTLLILSHSEKFSVFKHYLRDIGYSQVELNGFYYSNNNLGTDTVFRQNLAKWQFPLYGEVTPESIKEEEARYGLPSVIEFSETTFSQEAEDILVSKILAFKKNGFYVDIGAYHPIKYSNTYYFYKMGWSGVNVEPDAKGFALLEKFRPRDINVRKLVGDKTCKVNLFIFDEPALNTVSLERKNYVEENTKFHCVAEEELNMITVNDCLDEYVPTGQTINFMNIDVESMEVEIIESMDFNKYRPEVILIENRFFELEEKLRIEAVLFPHGYINIVSTSKTRVYTTVEAAEIVKF